MACYKPVTHVIFDLDGTLLTSDEVWLKVFESIALKHGKTLTRSQISRLQEGSSKESFISLIRELDLPISLEDYLNCLIEEFTKPVCDGCIPKPGVDRLVKHLFKNNIPTSIATNSAKSIFDQEKQHLKDLLECFHHVVTAGSDPEVEEEKPAPDAFLVCAKRFDEKPPPEKVLVIEDSVTGVKAAVAAGMQVVLVHKPLYPAKLSENATLVLETLEDFEPELFGLPPFQNNQ